MSPISNMCRTRSPAGIHLRYARRLPQCPARRPTGRARRTDTRQGALMILPKCINTTLRSFYYFSGVVGISFRRKGIYSHRTGANVEAQHPFSADFLHLGTEQLFDRLVHVARLFARKVLSLYEYYDDTFCRPTAVVAVVLLFIGEYPRHGIDLCRGLLLQYVFLASVHA